MVNQGGYRLTKAGNSLESLYLSARNLGSLFIGLVQAIHKQMDRWKGLIRRLNWPFDGACHFIHLRFGLIGF